MIKVKLKVAFQGEAHKRRDAAQAARVMVLRRCGSMLRRLKQVRVRAKQ